MAGFVPTRGFAAQGIACSRLRASPAFAGLVLSSRSSERPVLCQLSYAPTRQPYGTDMECLYNAIMADIEAFLTDHGIPFQRFDHPAVFTCEQAERIAPPMPGTHTKNLFLRDRKGARHLLVVVGYEKNVDLKALTALIGVDKLSFASPERLKTYLGVEPGAVSLLGLVNDAGHAVEVIFDEAVWRADAVLCHPLVNTATLVIPHGGIEEFLRVTDHHFRVLDVPSRSG